MKQYQLTTREFIDKYIKDFYLKITLNYSNENYVDWSKSVVDILKEIREKPTILTQGFEMSGWRERTTVLWFASLLKLEDYFELGEQLLFEEDWSSTKPTYIYCLCCYENPLAFDIFQRFINAENPACGGGKTGYYTEYAVAGYNFLKNHLQSERELLPATNDEKDTEIYFFKKNFEFNQKHILKFL